MIINILCDNKDSWFWEKNKDFLKKIKNKHKLNLVTDQKELVKGDIAVFISCNNLVKNEYLVLNSQM